MAKKTRKQKQRTAARRTAPVSAPGTSAQTWTRPEPARESPIETDDSNGAQPAAPDALAASSAVADPGATAPVRRRIERLSQAAPARTARAGRGPANAAAMFQPLEAEDAAIPFNRVPYVPADLRRVAVMAVLMVILILVAAVVVTRIVQ